VVVGPAFPQVGAGRRHLDQVARSPRPAEGHAAVGQERSDVHRPVGLARPALLRLRLKPQHRGIALGQLGLGCAGSRLGGRRAEGSGDSDEQQGQQAQQAPGESGADSRIVDHRRLSPSRSPNGGHASARQGGRGAFAAPAPPAQPECNPGRGEHRRAVVIAAPPGMAGSRSPKTAPNIGPACLGHQVPRSGVAAHTGLEVRSLSGVCHHGSPAAHMPPACHGRRGTETPRLSWYYRSIPLCPPWARRQHTFLMDHQTGAREPLSVGAAPSGSRKRTTARRPPPALCPSEAPLPGARTHTTCAAPTTSEVRERRTGVHRVR
jgi:hypothetical protein